MASIGLEGWKYETVIQSPHIYVTVHQAKNAFCIFNLFCVLGYFLFGRGGGQFVIQWDL